MRNAYQVLKKFLQAKAKRDEYNKEYRASRAEVLDTLGKTKQDGKRGDIAFNIYPGFAHKVNWGNFAKDYPAEFKRRKELKAEIKTLKSELNKIEQVARSNYSYRDTKAGPTRWTVQAEQVLDTGKTSGQSGQK